MTASRFRRSPRRFYARTETKRLFRSPRNQLSNFVLQETWKFLHITVHPIEGATSHRFLRLLTLAALACCWCVAYPLALKLRSTSAQLTHVCTWAGRSKSQRYRMLVKVRLLPTRRCFVAASLYSVTESIFTHCERGQLLHPHSNANSVTNVNRRSPLPRVVSPVCLQGRLTRRGRNSTATCSTYPSFWWPNYNTQPNSNPNTRMFTAPSLAPRHGCMFCCFLSISIS